MFRLNFPLALTPFYLTICFYAYVATSLDRSTIPIPTFSHIMLSHHGLTSCYDIMLSHYALTSRCHIMPRHHALTSWYKHHALTSCFNIMLQHHAMTSPICAALCKIRPPEAVSHRGLLHITGLGSKMFAVYLHPHSLLWCDSVRPTLYTSRCERSPPDTRRSSLQPRGCNWPVIRGRTQKVRCHRAL